MTVKDYLIQEIGEKETNRFFQILKSKYYLEMDSEGYLTLDYYIDYHDKDAIQEYVMNNFKNYKTMDGLIDNIMDDYYEYEYELFQPIRDTLYCLDINYDIIESLFDELRYNYIYVNYDDIYNAIYETDVEIEISLQTKDDKNCLDGKQAIKKYIDKNIWNIIKKDDDDFRWREYVLASELHINIKDFYELKEKNRLKIKGLFIIKDYHNGSYYDNLNLIDGVEIDANISLDTIQFDLGYTIDEISGDYIYKCEAVIQ